MRGIVFDVDGTLVKSLDFDSEIFVRAVRDCLGNIRIRRDWSRYRYVTDVGVLTEILEDNGLYPDQDTIHHVRERVTELLREHLADRPCAATEGVRELLDRLRHDPNCVIGITTGGWRQSAYAKLRAAGLDVKGIPLVSADAHFDRVMILSMCRDALPSDVDQVTYVGDGLRDEAAARQLGWDFIGIGPRLRERVEAWIEDFTDSNWNAVWRNEAEVAVQ